MDELRPAETGLVPDPPADPPRSGPASRSPRRRSPLAARLGALAGLAIAALLATWGITLVLTANREHAQMAAFASQIDRLARFEEALRDLDTGIPGIGPAPSGDGEAARWEGLLAQYHASAEGLGGAPPEIAHALERVAGSVERLDAIRTDLWAATAAGATEETALEIAFRDEQRDAIDRIREVVDSIRGRMRETTLRLSTKWRDLQLLLGLSCIAALLAAVLSYLYRRDLERRRSAESALAEARAELERRVVERTAELSQANAMLVEQIRERRRAEEEIARYADGLARSNAELQQFAYVASHDLQEPLRMVSSYVQLLGRRYRGRLDADADDFIQYAVDGAERMTQLIQDLLTYARLGSDEVSLEDVDCEALVRGVLRNLKLAIDESRAEIRFDRLPTVQADPTQLAQLLQNLIANAIRFRAEQPPRIRITVERRVTEWVFSVRDNGIGIDSAHFDRIFRLFQRLGPRSDQPGTGIGLAICRKIVERHGGRIWVDSSVGKGTTFFFSLPVISRDERPAPGRRARRERGAPKEGSLVG